MHTHYFTKRRIPHKLSFCNFLIVKSSVIVTFYKAHRLMFGRIRLNNGSALFTSSAGTSRNLFKHCKSSLTASVIVNIEHCICRYNSDKRYIFKIKSFCHHLRTDKNIDFIFFKLLQNLLVRLLFTRCIHIHSDSCRIWEQTV